MRELTIDDLAIEDNQELTIDDLEIDDLAIDDAPVGRIVRAKSSMHQSSILKGWM